MATILSRTLIHTSIPTFASTKFELSPSVLVQDLISCTKFKKMSIWELAVGLSDDNL